MSRSVFSGRQAQQVPPARSSSDAVRAVSPRRLRSLPYAAAGTVLVTAAVVTVAVTFVSIGGRVPVLVVDRPVQVGQPIASEDLRTVDIAPGTLTGLVRVDHESEVVGQPAALPLVPGEVLTRQLVGASTFPPVGSAVATVALKAGSFPQHLASGSHVQVVAPATATGTPAQVVAKVATVTEVSTPSDQGDAVVSMLTDEESAKAVSSQPPGTLSLILLPVGS